jgi:hypothetical protein
MSPGKHIDELIAGLADWRGPMLSRIREIFHEADPEVTEEWKWMGSPVWEHDGILAVGMPFKTSVKLGFMYGASLPDPEGIFNDELEGNQRRAIKFYEGDAINEAALKQMVRAAITFNQNRKTGKT